MKRKKSTISLKTLLQDKTVRRYQKQVKRNKLFAVIYTRVSSQEQAENNSSLEIQLKLCRELGTRMGLVIKKSFGGTYESAKSDGRKHFQEMLAYVKKDKDIAFIIVYNFDRFSRTGPAAAQLSNDLAKNGIQIKSVQQDIDSSTPTGKFQQNLFHLFNNYDNQQRASRTITNTREIMLKGYWPYHTPLGYENLKKKHRACDHQYVITEAGKWLKKAFKWKAEGVFTNKEIIERIRLSGLRLTEKNFRWIISNTFYTGYVTGSLIDGKLIKGHHPALIDLETFLKANNALDTEPMAHIPKTHRIEQLPLKIFARDEISGCLFTGYTKKGHWYYKTRNGCGKVNINAVKLNEQFRNFLSQFEYNKHYKSSLKKILEEKIRRRLEHQINDNVQLKKRLTEIENQLEGMEKRHVLGDLKEELYEKYSKKFKEEIAQIRQELESGTFDSSNLNLVIEKGLRMAENLSGLWLSADFSEKQKLQYLVFPQGILYSKEKDTVRTEKVNSLFEGILLLKRTIEDNKKGNLEKDCLKSSSVPGTGFELSLPVNYL